MASRFGPSIARAILLTIGVYTAPYSAVPAAYALDPAACTIPMRSCLCAASDESCAAAAAPGTLRPAAVAGEEPAYEDGIPTATLSLYKTITYVTAATLTDQV